MVTETDRAWLAGIWDGEGSISLFSNNEHNGSVKLKPVVNMVNTDLAIINKVLDILEQAGCKPYIVNRPHSKKNANHRDVVEIKFSSIPSIIPALELMVPYLCGTKRAKAEILLRYAKRRADKFAVGDRTYDEDDWNDYEQIRSSETTREAPVANSTLWKKI